MGRILLVSMPSSSYLFTMLYKEINICICHFHTRINELTIANEKYKIQIAEKENQLRNSQPTLDTTDSQEPAAESEALQSLREECEALHVALRDIAQAVLHDADGVEGDEGAGDETFGMDLTLPSPYSRSTPMR